MKTEMTKVYVQLRKINGWVDDEPQIEVNLEEKESTDSYARGMVCEMEIPLPVLTDEDKDQVMCGAELKSLQEMKERIQAETHRKLMQIDDRIKHLLAIEDKSNENSDN